MSHNWNDKNGNFHPASAMDFLPVQQLRRLQSQRLSEIVKLAYENVPLHRGRMDKLGVKPSDIKSIDDISKLPFTQKTDLRDTYPYGMFAVPSSEVVRLHASSGTTGYAGLARVCHEGFGDVRGQPRRFYAGLFRLWAFYRRFGIARRSRGNGMHCHTCFRRKYRAPAYDNEGFWLNCNKLYS